MHEELAEASSNLNACRLRKPSEQETVTVLCCAVLYISIKLWERKKVGLVGLGWCEL